MFAKLSRSLPACAVALALAAGGCSKEKDDAPAASKPGAAAAAVDWKSVDRVPFEQLQQIFPATVAGRPRTELAGSAQPAENPWTEANANYGDTTRYVTARLEDNPTYVADLSDSKVGDLAGHPVVTQSEADGTSTLQFVVAGRFNIFLQGTGIPMAELKTFATSLDLAKLASWKDHGKKK